jgi:cardiolipin synthase
LVPPIVWALAAGYFSFALVLFFVAGVSDGLDGFLAKQFDWTSRLGALLDPIADKLMLISSYVTLAWLGLLPVWLVTLVLLRDLVIVTGAVVYHFSIERVEAAPTIVSKLNTLLQIVLVLLVIAAQALGWEVDRLVTTLVYTVAVSTVWSGTDYVITWSRLAKNRRSASRP